MVGDDGSDVDRAPVAAMRYRATEKRPQQSNAVQALMREYCAMHGVPTPSRHVATELPGEIADGRLQSRQNGIVARLARRRLHIVTPRTVGKRQRPANEARDERGALQAHVVGRHERPKLVAGDCWCET